MGTDDHSGSVGFAILALLCALVALLALMVAGSKYLVGGVRGTLEGWQLPTLVMLATSVIYGVLAAACWRRHRSLRWLAPACLLALALLALPELAREGVLDLAVALVFLLAATANLALVGYTRMVR